MKTVIKEIIETSANKLILKRNIGAQFESKDGIKYDLLCNNIR